MGLPGLLQSSVLRIMIHNRHGKGKGPLLLLLLMSSHLIWQTEAAQPDCPKESTCWKSRRRLIDRAVIFSLNLHGFSSQLLQAFDKKYSRGLFVFPEARKKCHTVPTIFPVGEEQDLMMQPKDIVKLLIMVLQSWNDPLFQLHYEAHQLPEFRDILRNKIIIIAEKIDQIQEQLKKLASKIDPEILDNVEHAFFLELPFLTSTNEEFRLLAFHKLLHCLSVDLRKTHNYLMFLKCKFIYDGTC
nr:prolactin-like [Cavia porcellus]